MRFAAVFLTGDFFATAFLAVALFLGAAFFVATLFLGAAFLAATFLLAGAFLAAFLTAFLAGAFFLSLTVQKLKTLTLQGLSPLTF